MNQEGFPGNRYSGDEADQEIAAQIEEWQDVESQLAQIFDLAERDPAAAKTIARVQSEFFARLGGKQAIMQRLGELRGVVERMQQQLMRQQMDEQDGRG